MKKTQKKQDDTRLCKCGGIPRSSLPFEEKEIQKLMETVKPIKPKKR